MHKHRDIFRKFLGERLTYADIGRACGVGAATVWRWDNPHSNNGRTCNPVCIPEKHFPAIVNLAKSHGIKLTLNDFKKIELAEIEKTFKNFK